MTFEENFPSLKEWTLLDEILIDIRSGKVTLSDTKEKIFTQSSVQEHCFDKQKVKEAIVKIHREYLEYDGEYGDMLIVSDLLKELGLNNED